MRTSSYLRLAAHLVLISLVCGGAYGTPPDINPVSVTVPNYSFEYGSGAEAEGDWYNSPKINGGSSLDGILAGWDLYCGTYAHAGRLNPADTQYANTTDATYPPPNLPSPADDKQCAFTHWGTNSWGVNVNESSVRSHASLGSIRSGWDYKLDVAVGTPGGTTYKVKGIKIAIYAAGIERAYLLKGNWTGAPDIGTWENWSCTLTRDTIGSLGLDGQALTLRMSAWVQSISGQKMQANFDNVRLTGTTTALMGDANLDGIVDGQDFTYLKANYGNSGVTWGDGDFDENDLVDGVDFTYLKGNYGNSVGSPLGAPSSSPAPVPEPATVALLALGAAGVLSRRRRS